MKDTDRIREFVRKHPGKAAYYISNQLKIKSSTVSSALAKMVERGEMSRTRLNSESAWNYYERPRPD